jgi:hypothetical protein
MADTTRFDYRYPLTKLDKSDDYLKITVLDYKPPGFAATGFVLPTASEVAGYSIKDEKGTIILPIPEDVQDKNSATWGRSEIGPIAAGLAAFGQNAITNPTKIPANIQTVIGNILSASQTGTAQKAAQAMAIDYAKNVLIGSGNQNQANLLSRYSGAITNSNIELVFSSVNLRETFTFAFDIVPRSQKEAQQVKDIIRTFKKHSAAKKSIGAATGLFLKAPEVFKVEYMSGDKRHPYLNRFKICALQGMSVNYAPSNTYATYADGAPVNMILGLTFQELTPIYAEDYDKGVGTEGTGY